MSEFFKGFLSREIVSLTVMLAVLLARLLFRRAPKRLTVALWAVVCFRLLCPVSIDAPVSLVPKAAEQAASAVEDLPSSDELAALLGRACPELDFILSIVDWFDINPRGWSKADGVRILADELGIPLDEVVVFGDQANDLEMLELVPNSCAVANAVPAAAAAARWHIGDCADEAVARAMEQICEVAGTDEPPAFMRG